MAGRQKGSDDLRDMVPEFVRAVKDVAPRSFVMENVPALTTKKFANYLENNVFLEFKKLGYKFDFFELKAENFGVPQIRKRIFIVGFNSNKNFSKYERPQPTHSSRHFHRTSNLILLNDDRVKFKTKGVREALGLPDIGFDSLAPTIRSGLTGPRQTTSILSSVSAQKKWEQLQIWPNGVARTKEKARAFPARNDHYRLSIDDVAIMQGFPLDWNFGKAVYLAIGQIGNSVAPPVAFQVAESVKKALTD
jgi:DNA (cytosine-5)-methyltransferase 1